MTITISLRELSRNVNKLSEYDYVTLEDKKTHQFKGLFVSTEFAQEVKELIDSNEDFIAIIDLLRDVTGKLLGFRCES